MSQNGKGDKPCPRDWKKYGSGFDYIKWGKPKATKKKVSKKAAKKKGKRNGQ